MPSDRDDVKVGDVGSRVRPKGETDEVVEWALVEAEDGERWEASKEVAEKEDDGDDDKQSDASAEHSATCAL